ncbi:hypothetical protein MMC07_006046 [Pseudocyphellaria aurata]|nr:hypothetical protein [Pseudocyphellaria aurata]
MLLLQMGRHLRKNISLVISPSLAMGFPGVEAQDYGYKITKSRRRSNSSSQTLEGFKTKFEGIENDPVFEEELHGAEHEPEEDDHISLGKADTADSTSSASVEEEEHTKKL